MIPDRVSSPSRPWLGRGLVWVAGLCALGAASVAQARDLNWSIGIDSPGVSVGVSNHRPVVVYPQPVYGAPVYGRPVYVHPHPVYQVRPMPGYVQPVVVHPRPVVYQVVGPRWDDRRDRRHWKHKHRHHPHHWRDDDDRGGGGRR